MQGSRARRAAGVVFCLLGLLFVLGGISFAVDGSDPEGSSGSWVRVYNTPGAPAPIASPAAIPQVPAAPTPSASGPVPMGGAGSEVTWGDPQATGSPGPLPSGMMYRESGGMKIVSRMSGHMGAHEYGVEARWAWDTEAQQSYIQASVTQLYQQLSSVWNECWPFSMFADVRSSLESMRDNGGATFPTFNVQLPGGLGWHIEMSPAIIAVADWIRCILGFGWWVAGTWFCLYNFIGLSMR